MKWFCQIMGLLTLVLNWHTDGAEWAAWMAASAVWIVGAAIIGRLDDWKRC